MPRLVCIRWAFLPFAGKFLEYFQFICTRVWFFFGELNILAMINNIHAFRGFYKPAIRDPQNETDWSGPLIKKLQILRPFWTISDRVVHGFLPAKIRILQTRPLFGPIKVRFEVRECLKTQPSDEFSTLILYSFEHHKLKTNFVSPFSVMWMPPEPPVLTPWYPKSTKNNPFGTELKVISFLASNLVLKADSQSVTFDLNQTGSIFSLYEADY